MKFKNRMWRDKVVMFWRKGDCLHGNPRDYIDKSFRVSIRKLAGYKINTCTKQKFFPNEYV